MSVKIKPDSIKNICCFGANLLGVSTACVMAQMCPAKKIVLVDFEPKKVSMWNMGEIPGNEKRLKDMINKCGNKNLVFTTDTEVALRDADIIIIIVEATIKTGEVGQLAVPNLTEMENVVRLIAKISESRKIIVEKGSGLYGNCKVLESILKANLKKKINFEILSNPDFSPEGGILEGLLNPDRIIIGSDQTVSGLDAAETLASIYTHWVPREKIITMTTMESEISKIILSAFLAQKISNISALSQMCETLGGDISEVTKILGGHKYLSPKFMETTFGFGGFHLETDLRCLIFMLHKMHLKEEADYWQSVLDINDSQQLRFRNKIVSCFYNALEKKRLTVWGVSIEKNSTILTNSPAINLCRHLLKEGVELSIYDKLVDNKHILEELGNCIKDVDKCVTVFKDPYVSVLNSKGIIVCTNYDEVQNLDFEVIHKIMLRPAYIFDGRACLPDEKLTKMGFNVITVGKPQIKPDNKT